MAFLVDRDHDLLVHRQVRIGYFKGQEFLRADNKIFYTYCTVREGRERERRTRTVIPKDHTSV